MLHNLSPDAALLLLTGGLLLIYIELNRPGLIVSGALGLTFTLLALARFARDPIAPAAAGAGVAGALLLVLSARTRTHLPLALLSTAALLYAFLRPPPGPLGTRPNRRVAVPCALILGLGTSLLTTIAARARQNKGLDLK